MKAQIRWLRVFVEGVVIVGSILLAFGIEAWWDERVERGEIRQDLANITRELVDNRERIMFQLDLMDRMASGGEAMLKLMESDPATHVTNMPDTLAWLGTAISGTLDASLGAAVDLGSEAVRINRSVKVQRQSHGPRKTD